MYDKGLILRIQCYIAVRENLVNTSMKKFVITYAKQHKPASSDRISRWIKEELGRHKD